MIKNVFLYAVFVFFAAGCSQKNIIDHLAIGSGTKNGNSIFITDILVDNELPVFGGILYCCWQEAGNSNSIYNREPPKSVYVKWYDYDQDIYYGGTMLLSDKLYQYTQEMAELPNMRYRYLNNKIEKYFVPHLIFGFGETGEVVAWISNSYDSINGKEGRVLYEVGRIQAEVLPLPPRFSKIKAYEEEQQKLLDQRLKELQSKK